MLGMKRIMRRNIFDLMNNKEIDVEREFKRINKLFEKDIFDTRYPQKTLCAVIDEDYFN